jgi:hypothetical protein
MEKITLKEIDDEIWKFTLYESPAKDWFLDIVYSPMSAVDLSMFLRLTNEEKANVQRDRNMLISFCEQVSNNYQSYLHRAMDRNNFTFTQQKK